MNHRMQKGDLVKFLGPGGRLYDDTLGIVLGFGIDRVHVQWFQMTGECPEAPGHWPFRCLQVISKG